MTIQRKVNIKPETLTSNNRVCTALRAQGKHCSEVYLVRGISLLLYDIIAGHALIPHALAKFCFVNFKLNGIAKANVIIPLVSSYSTGTKVSFIKACLFDTVNSSLLAIQKD